MSLDTGPDLLSYSCVRMSRAAGGSFDTLDALVVVVTSLAAMASLGVAVCACPVNREILGSSSRRTMKRGKN